MNKYILFILFSILISSCVSFNRNYEVSHEEALKSSRLVIFETKFSYKLVYDSETGVEYFYAVSSNSGSDYLTPLLDAEGKPKIHKGYNLQVNNDGAQ